MRATGGHAHRPHLFAKTGWQAIQECVAQKCHRQGHTQQSSGLPQACLARLALRSEEHTSELQSRLHLVCRLLLEKKNAEVETGWLLKPTLRTTVLERIAALTTGLHPVGVAKAAVCAAHAVVTLLYRTQTRLCFV